ncbi:DUF4113 domain-containing protein (plasmid) [Azospirillum brasilense]|uniref:DUF4113 domain-containing protein n=1 Tax=Azospirillum brasilense TaxID=192 RepID=A0A4D8QTW7_AZOBR|nr:DUF4113 domain-containing protein [Azospirillum brasilense]NUB30727.1 DUF4113 domain-containing protein [Azospirillum brasilense]QCO12510.1 DUF4113 domain-containing protein [Azospirillum brasilense]QEL94053.1 DUF4113 domain-containing protein [Azospirillum brasilense]QEM00359.1 DUF4113 domain-containing protein [Azospirillum brasilense]
MPLSSRPRFLTATPIRGPFRLRSYGSTLRPPSRAAGPGLQQRRNGRAAACHPDSFALIAAATAGARRIWCDGFAMSKAGVILSGLVPAATMGRAWRMRQDSRSPSYTTELDDAPVVRA